MRIKWEQHQDHFVFCLGDKGKATVYITPQCKNHLLANATNCCIVINDILSTLLCPATR